MSVYACIYTFNKKKVTCNSAMVNFLDFFSIETFLEKGAIEL